MKEGGKMHVLGIDVGGTNIRFGLINEDYELSDFIIEKSGDLQSEKSSVNNLKRLIENYLEQSDKEVAAIAIGFPSTLDKKRKKILSTPNIRGLQNIDIVDILEEKFKIPVFIETDVNLLMINDIVEAQVAQEGIIMGVYLGTGVGNAIAINGELLTGKHGVAAELGHIPMLNGKGKCGCGNEGCVEVYASGKRLQEICTEHFKEIPISEIFEQCGEEEIIKSFVEMLALPVATEINILDPDVIFIGGGLISMKGFPVKLFEAAIHKHARKPFPEQDLHFNYSSLGQENGVRGAGVFAYKQLERGEQK